jgi:tRNA-specific 2-thiouridylase
VNAQTQSSTNGALIHVGMSGGVDSTVAAWRLKRLGYDVRGVFMKNWDEDDDETHCAAAEDLEAAIRACQLLEIPLKTVNFSSEYWDRVFSPFVTSYQHGHTPNPDVWCNREIKFGELIHFIEDLGGQGLATGHYARVRERAGRSQLCRARDDNKDQTYFLYLLTQQQLAKARFPIGDLTKPEVREIARAEGFENHDRRDSTGICFIGERPFREFLSRWVTAEPGEIVTPEGQLLGQHEGLPFYTLGQRQGLGIGGVSDRSGAAWYVVEKIEPENRLVVAQGKDHPRLYSARLRASSVHWISESINPLPLRCTAKTRYRQVDQPCTVSATGDGGLEVIFEEPQRAVTPGQAVVFYDAEVCLGGATIEERFPH